MLDVDVIQGVALEGNRPRLVIDGGTLPTLGQWQIDIGDPAAEGRVERHPDDDLTYFGYPYPPPGAIPEAGAARSAFDRCVSLPHVSATVASPVNLLFEDGEGNRIGADAAGSLIFDAPGLIVAGSEGNPSGYVLPAGDYTVALAGTAAGDAIVAFSTPRDGENESTVYTLDVQASAAGTLAIDGGSPAKSLTFGGAEYAAAEGLEMTLAAFPASLSHRPILPRRVRVEVKDPYGEPLAGASVEVTGRNLVYRKLTNARGIARVKIKVPAPGGFAGVAVSAPGFLDAVTQISTE